MSDETSVDKEGWERKGRRNLGVKEQIRVTLEIYILLSVVIFFYILVRTFLNAWVSPTKSAIILIDVYGEAKLELIMLLWYCILTPPVVIMLLRDLWRAWGYEVRKLSIG